MFRITVSTVRVTVTVKGSFFRVSSVRVRVGRVSSRVGRRY